jgi:hypothetical protein
MRYWTIVLAGIIALAMLAHVVMAQPEAGEKRGGRPGGRVKRAGERPAGPEGRRQMPISPLMRVLDANKDGKLSVEELNNAKAALLTLDKNGDGELTREEISPRRPGKRGGPEAADGAKRGGKGRRERKKDGGGAAE